MNLILLEPADVSDFGEVTLADERATHMIKVLRAETGRRVRVGMVDGPFGVGTVVSIAGNEVALRCAFETFVPRPPRIDLLLALPRPKVMRRLWAQLSALGVGQIILTNAERVERNYFDTHVLAPECYRPLLIEGLQQAKDTRLPKVSIHKQFKVLVEDELDALFCAGLRVVADPEETLPPGAFIRESVEERVLVAVGPEGGWNEFEMKLLKAHNFQPVGMGARTLRTDTACVALLALANDAMASRR